MAVRRDIIVVGASAGGVQALRGLVGGLPRNLEASILVAMHVRPVSSLLPGILSRSGPLPAIHPAPGEPIRRGCIYVAPPDHHMLVEHERIHLWRGPKENLHRPAVNPLFRSAAICYGKRVVGIVLSGLLDDGAAGLWWIKRHGGVAMVQDPDNAAHPEMPLNALQHVGVDYVLGVADMGPMLARLTNGGARAGSGQSRNRFSPKRLSTLWPRAS